MGFFFLGGGGGGGGGEINSMTILLDVQEGFLET